MRILAIAAAFLAAAVVPAASQTLSAAEVNRELIGKTICVQGQSGPVCIRHNRNNTSQIVSGMAAQQGTWRFKGNEHCITWRGAGERCSTFSRAGNGYSNSASGRIAVR